MIHRFAVPFAFLLVGLFAVASLAPALADDDVQSGKKYRIVRTNGKEFVGEVKALPNSYEVTVASGIVVTVPKSQVRAVILVDESESEGEPGSVRRQITDVEIEEILGSESVEDLEAFAFVDQIDLMEPLDVNIENLELMKRVAGLQANVERTDHFVLVHTSTPAKAKKLAARFEAVYKWRVWFLERMGVPAARPDYKFEMFFFGTHEEFQAYQALHGNISGALGFWHPFDNRSAFFDCDTYPPIAAARRRYSAPDVPLQIRRRGNNLVERWVENYNMEVVQHEAGHHIDFNIGFFPQQGDVPRWLVEGLTQMFEVPPSRMGAAFGKVNYKKLNELRMIYGPELQGLPPLRDFMLHDAIWFQGYNYPRGWAVVHYLINEFPDEFAQFMQILAQREDDWGVRVDITEKLSQMEELFGQIDDEWTQRFKDYMNAIPMRESELPPSFDDFP